MNERRGVLVIATTTVPECIDPAVVRQGRLETILFVPPPSREQVALLVQHYLSTWTIAQCEYEPILCAIANMCNGCAPSSVEFIFRECLNAVIAASGGADSSQVAVPPVHTNNSNTESGCVVAASDVLTLATVQQVVSQRSTSSVFQKVEYQSASFGNK